MKEKEKLFAFVLGRESDLALAELNSVLDRFNFCFDVFRISGNIAFAKIESEGRESELKTAFQALGGTIKIFQIQNSNIKNKNLGEHSAIPTGRQVLGFQRNDRHKSHPEFISESGIPNQVRDDLLLFLLDNLDKSKKVNFGISDYFGRHSVKNLNDLGLKLKTTLKKKGYKTRFVALKDKSELSSILSLKNDLVDRGIEIGLFEESASWRIGRLVYLNDPEKWNKRDYGKPAGDKFSGMLPPKLARMLVNLALGQIGRESGVRSQEKNTPDPQPQTLNYAVLDPFCGSGNVAMEAMMLGCDVVASDISEKAVEDTKANLNWLIQYSNLPAGRAGLKNQNDSRKFKNTPNSKRQTPNYSVFQADATSNELFDILNAEYSMLNAHDNFVVVTEPFLGKPKKFKPTIFEAEREYSKVKELYINFFKNIATFNSSIEARSSQPAASNNKDASNDLNSQDCNNSSLVSCPLSLIVCIVFPLIEMKDGKKYSLFARCVDELENLGYTQACNSFTYGRDYQVVKREIVLLKQEDPRYKKPYNVHVFGGTTQGRQ